MVQGVCVFALHISATRLPNVVSERVPELQTAVGIVAASDEEAVRTVAATLLFIVEIAELICELVLALITEARDEDAVAMVEFVFELIEET